MNKESLVEKYRPESIDEIYGHPTAVKKIRKWADNWSKGNTPLLLHGPAGTGKTSTSEAIANYAGWERVEINASSQRSSEDFSRLAQAIRSVGSTPTLYVLDEVDSMNGNNIQKLYSILDSPPNPIICTANEKWKVPDGLENRCKLHKFNLQKRSIKSFLKDVVEKEDISISNKQIGQLSTRNGIRDALNDLQEFARTNADTGWDERDTDDSPFAVTRRVILNKDYLGDMTPNDLVAFLSENVRSEFDGVECMRAYQALSEADKWLAEAQDNQNYSWWRYASPVAEEVSELRITEPYNDWVNINYPSERRNYTETVNSDTAQATLYAEIKENTDGFEGAFNFEAFKKVILPLMKNLDFQSKRQIALTYSLSDEAMNALEIDKEKFEEWLVEEDVGDSTEEEQAGISEFVEESDEDKEKQGLFDY